MTGLLRPLTSTHVVDKRTELSRHLQHSRPNFRGFIYIDYNLKALYGIQIIKSTTFLGCSASCLSEIVFLNKDITLYLLPDVLSNHTPYSEPIIIHVAIRWQ